MLDRIQVEREARAYISRCEWEKAISLYREILDAKGDDPNIYNLIGDVYVKMEDSNSAISEYLRAVELYENDGLYENGIAVCKKILRLGLNTTEVYFDLARLYAEVGLLTESIDSLTSYAKLSKHRKEVKKKPEKYKKLIALLADDESLKSKLKSLYTEINQREEELDKIFGLLPAEPKVVVKKPELIRETKIKPERETPIAEPSRQVIDEKEVQFLLHAINEIKASDFSKLEQIDHYKLGIEYRALGFYDASVRELQLASTIDSFRQKALCELGYCFLEKGEAKLAVNAFKQAIEEGGKTSKNYIELQYGLGRAYESLGDHDNALHAFEEVYLYNISYKDVKDRLSKLRQM
ncbi:MAG: tetratricopeptide repeat protein [bacterium]|nr:tetratricopeptide repeat protein [bacterium]